MKNFAKFCGSFCEILQLTVRKIIQFLRATA